MLSYLCIGRDKIFMAKGKDINRIKVVMETASNQ